MQRVSRDWFIVTFDGQRLPNT
eukprot:SAG25_NODE_12144_length_286_cov_1.197861_1_plen_21_part_10